MSDALEYSIIAIFMLQLFIFFLNPDVMRMRIASFIRKRKSNHPDAVRALDDPVRALLVKDCDGIVSFATDTAIVKRFLLLSIYDLADVDKIMKCFHLHEQAIVVTSLVYDDRILGNKLFLIIYTGYYATTSKAVYVVFNT